MKIVFDYKNSIKIVMKNSKNNDRTKKYSVKKIKKNISQ